jgi:hypothetical protein
MFFSLFHLGECHDFLVSGHPLGKGLQPGVSSKGYRTIPTHTLPLSVISSPLFPHLLGFRAY